MRTVVIPRRTDLSDADESTASTRIADSDRKSMVDPPEVTAIRLSFGVGPGVEAPNAENFKTTYTVEIPVHSDGLDLDGVYEFDVVSMFALITRRSIARAWGVRLELDLEHANVAADVYVATPFEDGGAYTIETLHDSAKGRTRQLTLGTTLVYDPKRVVDLNGAYGFQLRDQAPGADTKPQVTSLSSGVNVDFARFEFEA